MERRGSLFDAQHSHARPLRPAPLSMPGWGLNFSHQGSVILATWFACDGSGKATWRVALLLKNSERV